MRKWISLNIFILFLLIPTAVNAQNQIELSSVSVQLWPEFDQPSMLVIYDFTLREDISLPADVSIRIPQESNLIAVAFEQDGNLLNAPFEEPTITGDWKVVTVKVDQDTTYHIEYYAPLTKVELQRDYDFLWPGDYSVDDFNLTLRVPVDTTEITTEPQMTERKPTESGVNYLELERKNLAEGQQVFVKITYIKTSDRLATSGSTLEAGTVDNNTPGRISLANYLIYILGGVGVFLILASGYYFWKSGQRQVRPRKRRRSTRELDESEEFYCHQCGKRAQSGDRFCRTCGTRLRRES